MKLLPLSKGQIQTNDFWWSLDLAQFMTQTPLSSTATDY